MNNRFGLKDLVVIVLLLAIGVSLWLSMVQKDRQWEAIQRQTAKLDELAQQAGRVERERAEIQRRADELGEAGQKKIAALTEELAQVRKEIASARAAGASLGSGSTASSPAAKNEVAVAASDDSWARPEVPIAKFPKYDFYTDPRSQPGFREGGEVTEIYEAQLQKVVPFVSTDVYGRRVIDVVCQSLGAYDAKTLKMTGVLAEAWQIDPKGLWIRFKIRDKARFADGTPVTAEDIRWTFHDFMMDPQIDAERDRSILRDVVDKVVPISEKVVEFTFKDAFFSNLDNAATLFVLPKHIYSQFSPAEINKATGMLWGSGPYRMEKQSKDDQWTPPGDIVLVRNEQYWGPRPPLDRIRIRCVNDELPRLTAFKNGEAQIITPSVPQFKSLSQDPEFTKDTNFLNWVNMRCGNAFIAWNCGERNGKLTPFHDKRVRTAMTHLINREKMLNDIWKGLGTLSKSSWNPTSPASDPAITPLPYDPVRAKALLKEAGWEDRDNNGVLEDAKGNEFTFEFTYSNGGEIAERLATFIKDSAAAAGIRCTLRGIDWSVGEDIRKQRDFDATSLAWGATAPESDPKQIYHSESIKNQGDNFAQWNNPEADKYIDLGRKELDFEKRMKYWQAFERVMHEDQPYTWIRIQAYPRFFKKDVGNVNTYPKGLEMWEYFRGGAALPMQSAN
jgi:peptide/nickel transport system substrate-binding protein